MKKRLSFSLMVLMIALATNVAAQDNAEPQISKNKLKQNTGLFHLELEWREGLTLSEHYSDKYTSTTWTRSDYDFAGSHALQANILFNLPTRSARETGVGQWTVGVGAGLHRISSNNSLPVYLTMRYRPFLRQVPSVFAYADLGLSVLGKEHIYDNPSRGEGKVEGLDKSYDSSSFCYGPFGALGIGYQHMFKRHFGVSVKLGMHLQQFRRQVGVHYAEDDQPTIWDNADGTQSEYYNWHIDDIFYSKMLVHSLQLGVGVMF